MNEGLDRGYPYTTKDNRENRQYYMYSSYRGYQLIEAYIENRVEAMHCLKGNIRSSLAEVAKDKDDKCLELMKNVFDLLEKSVKCVGKEEKLSYLKKMKSTEQFGISEILSRIASLITEEDDCAEDELYYWLNGLVKSFEVHKRVYAKYFSNFKPVANDDYFEVRPYVVLALEAGAFYQRTNNLKFLNVLLKLNDTLISVIEELESEEDYFLVYASILFELRAIKEMYIKKKLDTLLFDAIEY